MSYFGTDGIRGQFGQFPITPEFIMALGYVTGQVLQESALEQTTKKIKVVVGKDTRLSGGLIESALQAGFNAAGVDVYLVGEIPTPAVSHLTRSYQADAGVVISASHNPHHDNGIKLFSAEGKKISDDIQNAINTKLQNYLTEQATFSHEVINHSNPTSLIGLMQGNAQTLGINHTLNDANSRYIEYCKGTFPYQLSLTGLKIVVDCAHGAGFLVAPRVFEELGADVVAIHHEPNGININDGCGSTHPQSLQQAVMANNADVGIALDGDGDRIVMVDHQGNVHDGDAILYILAIHAKNSAKEKLKGVVGTLMTNMALELAFAEADIDFIRAKVGDRYVMQELMENGWQLGGENSGHILCLDKSRTGDAIVAGLQVLSVMVQQNTSLRELIGDFALLPQVLVNVRLTDMRDPYDYPQLVTEFNAVEQSLVGRGRLLIRKSGTEPVIRVMIEAQDATECEKLANQLADKIKRTLQ